MNDKDAFHRSYHCGDVHQVVFWEVLDQVVIDDTADGGFGELASKTIRRDTYEAIETGACSSLDLGKVGALCVELLLQVPNYLDDKCVKEALSQELSNLHFFSA